MPKKAIYLVDDEPTILKAVAKSLQQIENCTVVCFETAESCLEQLRDHPCYLLITDVNLPGMHGIKLLETVKQIRPNLPVILITGYGDIPMAVQAVKLGAVDFIEKPLDEEMLISIVQEALESNEKNSFDDAFSMLTKTERKILKGIVSGHTNKEIAREMCRSVRTIENHRQRVMKKMQVNNTAELVRNALDNGIK